MNIEIAQTREKAPERYGLPPAQGLYDPQFEHDACGVGFVVNFKGKRSHEIIRQALTEDWPLSRLDSTLRAILRAGVYELMKREDVPVAVIVSEYVDIAKAFYEEGEPKLVNAVLDRVSRRVRGEGRGKDAS